MGPKYDKYCLVPWPESQKYIFSYDLYEDKMLDEYDAILGPDMSVLVREEILNKIHNGNVQD